MSRKTVIKSFVMDSNFHGDITICTVNNCNKYKLLYKDDKFLYTDSKEKDHIIPMKRIYDIVMKYKKRLVIEETTLGSSKYNLNLYFVEPMNQIGNVAEICFSYLLTNMDAGIQYFIDAITDIISPYIDYYHSPYNIQYKDNDNKSEDISIVTRTKNEDTGAITFAKYDAYRCNGSYFYKTDDSEKTHVMSTEFVKIFLANYKINADLYNNIIEMEYSGELNLFPAVNLEIKVNKSAEFADLILKTAIERSYILNWKENNYDNYLKRRKIK